MRIINNMAEIAALYDAFILDMWGVLHDGINAYPHTCHSLSQLKALGKKTLLLSNAPRRNQALIERMESIGIPRDLYDHVVSSGEATYYELKTRRDPFFAKLGPKLYHLGPDRDTNIYETLDYQRVKEVEAADFVLNTGPVDLSEGVADYRPILEKAAQRKLPMVCANPDHEVISQGRMVMCAGKLAAVYAEISGCPVAYRGKPDPAIYQTCMEILQTPKERILAVGDSLGTDIQGATNAGIDSLLVMSGIHRDALPTRSASELKALVDKYQLKPVAAVEAFVWP